ncbi:MAG: hypothetical protein H0X30_11795 [Anaerolineae bacterium]|nr:hypothetical protein [Anaerolineae bacterium]
MRRTAAWIFLLGMLFGGSLVSAQGGGLLTSLARDAKFRDGPGTSYFILGVVKSGTTILLDGRAPGGGWVRGITPDAKIGWVVDTSVAANADQIAALPKVWTDVPFTLGAPAGNGGVEAAAPPAAASNPTPVPAAAEQTTANVSTGAANGVEVKVGSNVNMRDNPNGGIIERAKANAKFVVDGKNATQDWVRGTLPSGAKGWIAVRYVVITGKQVEDLPVVEGGASGAPSAAAAPATTTDGGAAPAAPIVPVVASTPIKGFSYGGHVDGFGDATVNAMHQAGMSWAKRQWRYIAGQNPGDVAGIINDAHAKGFRILIGIVGQTGDVNNGGYFDQYAAFVGGVAAQGADAIEVWNEMNIDREWPSGSIDPGKYTDLLRRSYGAIKAANPGTLVISGAPAPTGYFGGCSAGGCDDAAYIAGMAAAGAANYMDCVGLHYNEGILSPNQTSGDPRGSSGYYTRYFWGMVNTYSKAFRGARPLCFTELGYLTPEGFPPLPGSFGWAENVTVGQQASWIKQAVALSRSSGKVKILIVWNIDFTSYGDDPMAGYAIIRPGGACPACEALAN